MLTIEKSVLGSLLSSAAGTKRLVSCAEYFEGGNGYIMMKVGALCLTVY